MTSLVARSDTQWELERRGDMRVPAVVFASDGLLPHGDHSLAQLENVACLPGIVQAAYAMPDVHEGYGFPIGAVAATAVDDGGVVSPGGVGFDISCGVRLLLGDSGQGQLGTRLNLVMEMLGATIPRGMGKGGLLALPGRSELDQVLVEGCEYLRRKGIATQSDLDSCEDGGVVSGAQVGAVSSRAADRGLGQVGSLGSGNHFLEVQAVQTIYDPATAAAFGMWLGQVCVMIHCGSRGLGHQICSDHVAVMLKAMARHGISVPDEQLACAPVTSEEGRAYLGAMAAAANYGRVNRQVLSHATRQAFTKAGLGELRLLYDVSHNLAKLETHQVSGRPVRLCVHRKGATRAFGPGHGELPEHLRPYGQPVLVPGSMGTASYVLTGVSDGTAFASTCHGAGRVMSRHASARAVTGEKVSRQLQAIGIAVRGGSMRGLAEEAPLAYKDVDEVVRVCQDNRLGALVARLVPLGVVKG
ncbi:MAG TPA: RtcB family protein [Candidatus Limnocylindrales bacterium]|nr:RtcB family protein [Candidatus Limnocylindrales bacterium]